MKNIITTVFTMKNAKKALVAGVAVVAAAVAIAFIPQADVSENVSEEKPVEATDI